MSLLVSQGGVAVYTKLNTSILLRVATGKSKGFTLIELLVVLVMAGILAAIALPMFLNRANAAKQTEAQIALNTINRAQQAYYLQHSKFADAIEKLEISFHHSNYGYRIQLEEQADKPIAAHYATPRINSVRSYVSTTTIVQDQVGGLHVETVICESEQPRPVEASTPTYNGDSVKCSPGTKPLTR